MKTTVTCDACGQVDELAAIPDRHTCSSCGAITVFVQPPPVRRKVAFSPGWKFMAEVVSHPSRGLLLACDRPAVFKPFVMEDGSRWKTAELATCRASFEVVRTRNDGALVVRLIGTPPKVRRQLVVRIPAERLSKRHDIELPFPPIGESELEKMVAAKDPGVVARVDALASRRDDPTAWWVLALGHRAKVIRRAVEPNLRSVGIEKIDRMLRQSYFFDWDIDLLDFVGHEMAKPRPVGGKGQVLPGDRSGWDKPWWADD